jgi:hypothetical protein
VEWNPSYDFRLFDIGWISPLQANEYGAATSFRASDPTTFVDQSINLLSGLLNPRAAYPYAQRQIGAPIEEVPFLSYFQGQSRAQIEGEAARKKAGYEAAVAAEMERIRREGSVSLWDMILGRTVRSGQGTGPILGSKETASVDDAGMAKSTVPDQVKAWIAALPAGSGVFLIAIVALIFLFLFARGR